MFWTNDCNCTVHYVCQAGHGMLLTCWLTCCVAKLLYALFASLPRLMDICECIGEGKDGSCSAMLEHTVEPLIMCPPDVPVDMPALSNTRFGHVFLARQVFKEELPNKPVGNVAKHLSLHQILSKSFS